MPLFGRTEGRRFAKFKDLWDQFSIIGHMLHTKPNERRISFTKIILPKIDRANRQRLAEIRENESSQLLFSIRGLLALVASTHQVPVESESELETRDHC